MSQGYDLIVVGGGPGGTTLSTLVSKMGHRVLLLEKEIFPRHQIGESLLPSTVQGICQMLGIKEEVDASNFVPKRGGTFIWGKSQEPWSFNFDYTAVDRAPEPMAYQVERHKFDHILLKNAEKNGVEVKQNVCVLDVLKENGRVIGVQYQTEEGKIIEVKSTFVIDASGNRSSLSHHVGERISSEYFDNIAIYGYFNNGKRLPPPTEGNITCVAFKHGWFWYIPLTLSRELTSVGVVVDKRVLKSGEINLEEIFNNHINQSSVIKNNLSEATRATGELYGKLRIRKDYSYTSTKFWMPGMAVIGDAACFIDPVFSSGVHLTTFAGLLAARCINTILRKDLDEETCFNQFERSYRKEFANFYNFLVSFYDMDQEEEEYFWAAKKIIKASDRPDHAFIKLISGYSNERVGETVKQQTDFNDLIKGAVFNNRLFGVMTGVEMNMKNYREIVSKENFMVGFNPDIIELHAKAMGMYGHSSTEELVITSDLLHWSKD
jgi:halogenation protein CepH